MTVTMTVRLRAPLAEYVQRQVGEYGAYDNVSEYVRDLIRRDQAHAEERAFERLKAELALAFAAPESSYLALTAQDIIERNPVRTDMDAQD